MKSKPLSYAAILLAFAASTPLALAQDRAAEVPAVTESEKPEIAPGTITAVLADGVTFSILTKALKAAELDVVLADTKGVNTIFAPTDEAFKKLPDGALDALLLPQNKEKLRSLLLYHVVPGKVMAADLKDGDVTTLNGEKIEVDVDSDEIEVEDTKVFSADVSATNGVVHSIGEVLVPESLDGFAGLDD